LSLLTRILGFGLCLLGAFTIGYFRGISAEAGTIGGVVSTLLQASNPAFAATVAPELAGYIQQNVTSTLDIYTAIGFALSVGGAALTAMGDRKRGTAGKDESMQPKVLPSSQQR